jgi:exodeoxyribonuclease-5
VIVGKNKTRRAYNRRIRELMGHDPNQPVDGDRVICLRNNGELGLFNGSMWHVTHVHFVDDDRVNMSIEPDEEEGADALQVEAHMHHFQGRGDELPWWDRKEAQEFDYGYAITCHKAQASQYRTPIVLDQSFIMGPNPALRRKWRYTAISRAIDSVTVALT